MSTETKIKRGAKVHYTSPHGKKENGIVKSVGDDHAFVVYHCDDDWDNYQNFTGNHTSLDKLTYGWVDEKGNLMPEFCDHHYLPTNSKWASATQVECQWCGDIIN